MRTSRLVSLALAIVPVLSTARAQAPRPAQDSIKHPPIIVAAVRVSLRGVELSETQQATIKGIVNTHRPQLVVVRDSMKPWRVALQTARQNNDTAAARVARVALRRGRLGVAAITRDALQQVRATLTAAQQAQFDANVPRVKAMLTRFVRGGAPWK
jgi:hypothetical protein